MGKNVYIADHSYILARLGSIKIGNDILMGATIGNDEM